MALNQDIFNVLVPAAISLLIAMHQEKRITERSQSVIMTKAKEKTDQLQVQFDHTRNMIERVQNQVESIKEDMSSVKERLARIESKLDDR